MNLTIPDMDENDDQTNIDEDDDIANTLMNPIMTCVHLLEDIDTDEHHATIRDNITEY